MVPKPDLSPAACVPARPMAWHQASSSRPSRWAQAAAAPKVPKVPVEWNPAA